jgi:peptide/nickel transport system permease protein
VTHYVLRRLLALPLLLLGVATVTFLLVHAAPGGPTDALVGNPRVSREDRQRIERSLGLGRPVHEQYLSWLGNVMHGDFGVSLKSRQPVTELIWQRLPATLLLIGSAWLVTMLVAIPLGVAVAVRRNSRFDHATTIASAVTSSLPSFWVGLILIIVFAVQFAQWGLPTLPSGGTQSVSGGGDLGDWVRHLVLPVLSLSLIDIAYWTRYVRGRMLESIGQDYVQTARAKGLGERTVLMRHAFRNASLPLITLVGLYAPALVGGAAFIETIFSWPGIGQLSVQAALQRDFPVVMGTTMLISAAIVLGTLLADILYGVADPRVRYSQ